ncbi:uncharacterized protein [Dysidea avara]|uniref:uncharacterized protein n=1 Tax=Dysidea avara TaxID=196820 RepID=UPI00332403E1
MNKRKTFLVLFGGVILFLLVVYYEVVSSDSTIFVNFDIHSLNAFIKTKISTKENDAETPEITAAATQTSMVEHVTNTDSTTEGQTRPKKITEASETKNIAVTTKASMKTEHPTMTENNTEAIKATTITKPITDATVTTTTVTKSLKTTYKKFAVCHSYWEQQTNAVLNMWSFQKWAKKSGNFSVLEPFAHDSVLGFSGKNVNQHNFNTSLRFRDYFDLDHWTEGTEKYEIPSLVNWSDFVEHASRNIVLAVSVYGKPGGIFKGDDIKSHPGCVSEAQRFRTILKNLLGFLRFTIEKVVCYSFVKYFNTLEIFNSPFDPNSNSTIYFTLWTGIGRIGIGDKTLQRLHEPDVLTMMLPSARILADSRNYVKHVLNVDFQGYTAIVFRTVRRLQEMKAGGFNHSEVIEHYYDCIGQLPDILEQFGLKPFLATDIGRFGDQTNANARSPEFMKMFQHLIDMFYGNKTVSEYEEDFISAANGISDTGYIGAMQKAIALKAKCIIMIGGFSTFQDSLIEEFKENGDCITKLCYGKPFPPKKTPPPK